MLIEQKMRNLHKNWAMQEVKEWFEIVEMKLQQAAKEIASYKKEALTKNGSEKYEIDGKKQIKIPKDTLNAVVWAINSLEQLNFRFELATRATVKYIQAFEVTE